MQDTPSFSNSPFTFGRRLMVLAALASIALVSLADRDQAASAEQTVSSPVWGLEGTVASETNNFNSQVFAMEQIGNVMYVGGKFTTVVSGPGGTSYDQPVLAAFNASTGDWISTFTPNIEGGAVYDLTASADGSRLFVTGEFTSVSGLADTAGLVAINPSTGAVDPTWRAALERPWTNDKAVGRSLDISGDYLYIGGTFTHVRSGSSYQQHSRLARVDLATGQPDLNFDPSALGGGVWDIDVSPDGTRLYAVGFFSSVNGNTSLGDRFAAIDTTTGELVQGVQPFTPNLDQTGRQYAVVATNDLVFVAGEEHMMQVLDGTTLARVQVYMTGSPSFVNSWPLYGGGDYQTLELVGDRVYAGCHCWSYHLSPDTGGQLFGTLEPPSGDWTPINAVAAYDASTGAHLDEVSFNMTGAAGAWSLAGASDGCLWVGGAISQADDAWAGNLARFCPSDQIIDLERPSTPAGLQPDAADVGTIALRWTSASDNVDVVGYEIYRSSDGTAGPLLATTSIEDPSAGTSFVDSNVDVGQEYTYAVKAFDAAGNLSWRSNLVTATPSIGADTERPSVPRGLSATGAADGISLTWTASTDNVAVTGYSVYRSSNGTLGELVASVPAPADLADDVAWIDEDAPADTSLTYAIKATDAAGNESWRSNFATASFAADGAVADQERPSTPTGLVSAYGADNTSVELSWNEAEDNVAVTGYNIFRSTDGTLGDLVATVDATSWTDPTVPDADTFTYAVKAVDAAGNQSWRSNLSAVRPR